MSNSRSTTGGLLPPTPKTIDEIARQQGITEPQDLDRMFGAAADLWESDEAFDNFVAGIYQRRRSGRSGERFSPK